MTTRRNFLGAALTALTGTAVYSQVEATLADDELPADDVGKLLRWIDIYGAEAVATEIVAVGRLDLQEIKRRLNRQQRRDRRHADRAKRRERHAGDEVLYRGPLRLWQRYGTHAVLSSHRHIVHVTETDVEHVIADIGVAGQDASRSVSIPAGSRLLIDARRGMSDVMATEVVRTARGVIRWHLWLSNVVIDGPDTCPVLRGGVAYESHGSRETGLLGLSLQS